MSKTKSICGVVNVLEEIRISKAGDPYINFLVNGPRGEVIVCQAFGVIAQGLHKNVHPGDKISLAGYQSNKGDSDRFVVKGFNVVEALEDTPKTKQLLAGGLKPITHEPTEIEVLMDRLGPARVNEAIRSWRADGGIGEGAGYMGVAGAIKSFDLAGYKQLIKQLWEEVSF